VSYFYNSLLFLISLSGLCFYVCDVHSRSFTSSLDSEMPSPVTPSLPMHGEDNMNISFQNHQRTFSHLQDGAWVVNADIHGFDHQNNGAEKNGWDNFAVSSDGTELHYPGL
jgi:hypothetical protein